MHLWASCIMHIRYSAKRYKSSSKSPPSNAHMDHLIKFSRNYEQNKPRVLYALHAHMTRRLSPNSVAPYKFFRPSDAIRSLFLGDLYRVE